MKSWITTITTTLFIAGSSAVFAISGDKLPEKKKTEFQLYLTALEANSMVSKNPKKTLFLDIRTRAEINFLGMAKNVDANIPYFTPESFSNWDEKKKNFSLSPNSGFLTAVEERLKQKGLNKSNKIVLICRSGGRSARAADLMKKAGYKAVYTVVDGFEGDKAKQGEHKGQRVVNGWKNNNLPWSYKLDKNKMYFDF